MSKQSLAINYLLNIIDSSPPCSILTREQLQAKETTLHSSISICVYDLFLYIIGSFFYTIQVKPKLGAQVLSLNMQTIFRYYSKLTVVLRTLKLSESYFTICIVEKSNLLDFILTGFFEVLVLIKYH